MKNAVVVLMVFILSFALPQASIGQTASEIQSAIAAELPSSALQASGISEEQSALLSSEVVALAGAVVSQTERDGLYASGGAMVNGVVVSVTSIPFDGSWARALGRFPDAQFNNICRHYAGQATGLAGIVGYAHIYLGVDQNSIADVAIGAANLTGGHTCFPPREFVGLSPVATKTLALEDLAPKRDDASTEGAMVSPGEGYLVQPEDVAASQAYWQSLDPQTRELMKMIIQTDHSAWLISEKNIWMFDVDRANARAKAIQMWDKELAASSQ